MPIAIKIIGGIMGVLMILGSIFDWDWMVNGRREQRMQPLIGRLGIRILYGFVGFAAILGIILLYSIS